MLGCVDLTIESDNECVVRDYLKHVMNMLTIELGGKWYRKIVYNADNLQSNTESRVKHGVDHRPQACCQ